MVKGIHNVWPNVKIAFGIVGTIMDGVAKAKKMEPKLPD